MQGVSFMELRGGAAYVIIQPTYNTANCHVWLNMKNVCERS